MKPVGRTDTHKPLQVRVPIEAYRRAIFGQNSIQEQVRNNTGGDIDVSLDDATARVSEVFTQDGMPSHDIAMRNVVDAVRSGRTATTNAELQDIVRGGQKDLDAARADYLAKGFQEVHMNGHEVVFVKSADPMAAADVATMLQDRVSDHMYRVWMDDWNRSVSDSLSWVYDAGESTGCRSCSNGACSTTKCLDGFILRGTINPIPEPTPAELAEQDMTDAERAENALLQGDYALALDRYQSYLKSTPEDAASIRGLGVALLQSNRVPEAITRIGEAYRLDPTLAGAPMRLEYFENGARTITTILERVVPMANRAPQYDASLAAAVLMQAQGRAKEAARMIDKAVKKGLPEAIQREFSAAAADAKDAGK